MLCSNITSFMDTEIWISYSIQVTEIFFSFFSNHLKCENHFFIQGHTHIGSRPDGPWRRESKSVQVSSFQSTVSGQAWEPVRSEIFWVQPGPTASETVGLLGPRAECLLRSPSPRGIQRHSQGLRTSSWISMPHQRHLTLSLQPQRTGGLKTGRQSWNVFHAS